jgi:hypothetical protein
VFRHYLSNASQGYPLTIYAGSYPDYSHDAVGYTFRGVGSGVPFLTKVHLESDVPFLQVLDLAGICYQYIIMVADVEATDKCFQQRFTDGDEKIFLGACESSRTETQVLLDTQRKQLGLIGPLKSSSFFAEFGRERFLRLQEAYEAKLQEKMVSDRHFEQRVTLDTLKRMEMYRLMYSDYISGEFMSPNQRNDFLMGRTMRTMAQYVVLGELISQVPNAIVINHPTTNIGFYNEKMGQIRQTIPIFEMKRRVYK